MEDKILIADVIPATKLPKDISQFFSYAVPDELRGNIREGSIVKIPLRKQTVAGIVFNIRKENSNAIKYKLKNISGSFENNSELPARLIELARHISHHYHTPISYIIKTILPEIIESKPKKDITLNEYVQIGDIPPAINEKIQRDLKEKNLLVHNLSSCRHNLYLEIIKRSTSENGQALILLPEFFDIFNFSYFYIDALGRDKVSILTSDLRKNLFYQEWKKVIDGKTKLLIGTRQAVFAPFKKLELVIADNEHSPNYKQWDMNPRYNAINACDKLASVWKAKLILSSPSPSVETFFRSTTKELNLINIADNAPRKQYEIIDMKTERENRNFSIFSEKLKKELPDTIYNRNQALIFIPKLGLNTVTKCKDCEYMARCEDCSTLLSIFKDNLYCTHCKKKSELMKICPKCKGQNISSFGYAIETVEKEIRDMFKDKNIRISRLDSTTAEYKSQQKKIYDNFIKGKLDILVGTQMAIKNWNLERLSLIIILYPEIFFNQPDFRSRERSFQFLMGIKNEAIPKQKIIIQTFNAENDAFRSLRSENIESFYEKELLFRKSASKIGYPPFSNLIKLLYKNKNKDMCKKEALELFDAIYHKINASKELRDNFEIIRPYPAQSFKEYGKFRYYIIIKCATNDIAKRDIVLNEVKKDWIIDIDPDSLL